MASWVRYRFAPSPAAFQVTDRGFRKSRSASVEIVIDAPVGSQMVTWIGPESGRKLELLKTWFSVGLDAAAAYGLAEKGERGFSLYAASQPASEVVVPVPPIVEEPTPIPLRWCIAFSFGHGYATVLKRSSLEPDAPLASTLDPEEAAIWESAEDVLRWLEETWCGPGVIPVGTGMKVEAPSSLDSLLPLRGVAFELPRVLTNAYVGWLRRSGPRPEPARGNKARTGQTLFEFA
jgi:hypothetical protein